MGTTQYWSIYATVCADVRESSVQEFRKILPDTWRSVLRAFAAVPERRRVPETHEQLALRAIVQKRFISLRVNELFRMSADRIGPRWRRNM
jgi:hypothetical protein